MVAFLQGKTDAVSRDTVGEVGGAVEGVDDPAIVVAACGFTAFFVDETRAGDEVLATFDEHFFSREIDIGNEVVLAFVFDLTGLKFICFAAYPGAGFADEGFKPGMNL